MKQILWVAYYVNTWSDLDGVFAWLTRDRAFRVLERTWFRPGSTTSLINSHIALVKREKVSAVVLHRPGEGVPDNMLAIVRGFQAVGAKVLLINDLPWSASYGEDDHLPFPMLPSVALATIQRALQ